MVPPRQKHLGEALPLCLPFSLRAWRWRQSPAMLPSLLADCRRCAVTLQHRQIHTQSLACKIESPARTKRQSARSKMCPLTTAFGQHVYHCHDCSTFQQSIKPKEPQRFRWRHHLPASTAGRVLMGQVPGGDLIQDMVAVARRCWNVARVNSGYCQLGDLILRARSCCLRRLKLL